MRIEVICTGDEVLTGKVVNTNFSTIAQKLEDCGLAAEWETTVGAPAGIETPEGSVSVARFRVPQRSAVIRRRCTLEALLPDAHPAR